LEDVGGEGTTRANRIKHQQIEFGIVEFSPEEKPEITFVDVIERARPIARIDGRHRELRVDPALGRMNILEKLKRNAIEHHGELFELGSASRLRPTCQSSPRDATRGKVKTSLLID
jgi:hypothetical protein